MSVAFITGISGQDGSYLTELVIEKQYPDGTGVSVEGNGSIAGNTITIQYSINFQGSAQIIKSCIVNMNK